MVVGDFEYAIRFAHHVDTGFCSFSILEYLQHQAVAFAFICITALCLLDLLLGEIKVPPYAIDDETPFIWFKKKQ